MNESNYNGQGRMNQTKDNVLKDIQKLKSDYQTHGGNDSNFVKNLNNLEEFYQRSPGKQPKENNESGFPKSFVDEMNNNSVGLGKGASEMEILRRKDEEKRRLQEEIARIKAGQGPPVNTTMMQRTGNLNLGSMGLKMAGLMQSNPFSAFLPQKEFFIQNEVRSVDLSLEERTLMSLVQQEVDSLRVISQIPIGTELYKFKMEQFKELSATRAEIEKIVQEQRLQRLRREFEEERLNNDRKNQHEKWIADTRMYIINQRIRRDLGQGERKERGYDPNEGLIVHWDYVLGLSKRSDLC